MTADGVIPAPEERSPYRHLVGAIHTQCGATISVGVDHDAVTISNGGLLTSNECEEFAQVLVSAVWCAGINAARMVQEAVMDG